MSATCGSSIRRPDARCESTRAAGRSASASRLPPRRSGAASPACSSALAVPHAVLSTSGDWLRPFAAFLGARR